MSPEFDQMAPLGAQGGAWRGHGTPKRPLCRFGGHFGVKNDLNKYPNMPSKLPKQPQTTSKIHPTYTESVPLTPLGVSWLVWRTSSHPCPYASKNPSGVPPDFVCHASNRRRRCDRVQAVCVYACVNAMLQTISRGFSVS